MRPDDSVDRVGALAGIGCGLLDDGARWPPRMVTPLEQLTSDDVVDGLFASSQQRRLTRVRWSEGERTSTSF